ncbi:hypothetical protein OG871_39710 (plasmid) [Kitasatospora sp. NBC_00374]|uniref:hypothetical protein n=1 Tax=Kitasatospora sp. NBC_00374 TaxID=2975964 RepID=UPI002F916F78
MNTAPSTSPTAPATQAVPRPLVVFDIDGVLSPYDIRADLTGYTSHEVTPQAWRAWAAFVQPRPTRHYIRLNPEIGARLEALPVDLVIAGPWQPEEIEALLPALGLTRLPALIPLREQVFFVRLDDPGKSLENPAVDLDWRGEDVLAAASLHRVGADRPLAWLAGGFTDWIKRTLPAAHAAPLLLHEVDHRIGLTDTDFATLAAWATAVAARPPAPELRLRRCRDCGERSSTVVDGQREDRTHDVCGSCCECYCPDPASDGGDRFQPCGDLERERCQACRCCANCGCGC